MVKKTNKREVELYSLLLSSEDCTDSCKVCLLTYGNINDFVISMCPLNRDDVFKKCVRFHSKNYLDCFSFVKDKIDRKDVMKYE